ncbi:type I-E CRISPR-associated protein Cas6/Cse3/CasE [Streptomyces cacaoi]|uniref:type I-E CRISPR-associated protein Cas6/Cse3/CasE n=1 Tax=Streptomyces cacaoi TaxID=1898 RepID=UPI003749755E
MTLWLTRILPSAGSPQARGDLDGTARDIRLHRRLLQMFPDSVDGPARAQFGVLFRAEDTARGMQILMQSSTEPDPSRLPDGYGQAETRSLDRLLRAMDKGTLVNYRCTASPVRKPTANVRKLYNLPAAVPLRGDAAVEWWTRQADAAGMEPLRIEAQAADPVIGQRGGNTPGAKNRVSHARVRFDGTARVTDPDLLRERLAAGIGRGKAYGCGLLTLSIMRGSGQGAGGEASE